MGKIIKDGVRDWGSDFISSIQPEGGRRENDRRGKPRLRIREARLEHCARGFRPAGIGRPFPVGARAPEPWIF